MKNSFERTERLLNAHRQLLLAARVEAEQMRALIEDSRREAAVAERYLNAADEGTVPPLLVVRRLAACENAVERNTILLEGLVQRALELSKIEILLKKRLEMRQDEKSKKELRLWLAEAIDTFLDQVAREKSRN
ncbi:hypothetical protein JDN40_17595 [Rhodomicrobium vannielii ATCC 17100]|uniref:hypothetical protein n=1 Tax=Rhodomicrobium vannielii TaxID=1069 RepID=UPI001917A595|nr:hypothetical protein [Rhodomicrobium vannielii]MBJ7535924.1 hypothetical protein [Rhodomicrobium vannielii ATCC 17100]